MDLYQRFGLRRVINANDKATSLGGARVLPEIAEVATAALGQAFELDDMQAAAGRAIAAATGAEWGCVTACAAAGITLNVAATMTGTDPAKVAQLPDTTGLRDRVVIQKGHCINFGVAVTQLIRLSGAKIVEAGTADRCTRDDLRRALDTAGVAALFAVESYHTVGYAGLKLPELVELGRQAHVPVLVDVATQELRLRELVATGVDLIGCSAHKYLGSTTAGVIAGRRALVEAVNLQHKGIGRGMKAGKEAILGVMAAFESSLWRDPAAWSRQVRADVEHVAARLAGIPGVTVTLSPDPNGCPFDRVRLAIDPARAARSAAALRQALREEAPAVHVRIYAAEPDSVYLNTTEMTPAEMEVACARIRAALGQ